MMRHLKKNVHKIVITILRWQVQRFLSRHPLPIVAVTGSVGKTMTKLAIARVLSRKYKVLVHPGNYNSETGVPLSIFELESPGKILSLRAWLKVFLTIEQRLRQPYQYELLVLELGATKYGDISYFKFLKPKIGVVTAVKPAHLQDFKDLETILNEKWQLALFSETVVANADEKRLASKLAEMKDRPLITYGVDSGTNRYEPTSFDWQRGHHGRLHLVGQQYDLNVPLIGRHNLGEVAAAATVGQLMGVAVEDIIDELAKLPPVDGRMNPLKGINDSLIIDDSYNSNPEAVTPAIDTLQSMPGRHLAILGSMNELAAYSADMHRDVGLHCGQLDILVTVGSEAGKYLAPAAIEAGLRADQVHSFDDPYTAGRFMAKQIQAGDKILVKGSQNRVFAEEATALLLADPADRSHLVRQSPFWQNIKRRAFPDQ